MAGCGRYGVKAGGWQTTTGILGTKYMKETRCLTIKVTLERYVASK
jgi:hypothetical protein